MWTLIIALVVVGYPHAKPSSFAVVDGSLTPSKIVESGWQDGLRQLEPIWVKQTPTAPAAERLTIIEGQGQVLTSKVTPFYYDFVTESTEATRMRVNTFYFPGWTVFVDEVERPVDIENLTGVMEFPLGPGRHRVQVEFANTPIRKWSERLSLLALVLLFTTPWMIRGFRLPNLASSRNPK